MADAVAEPGEEEPPAVGVDGHRDEVRQQGEADAPAAGGDELAGAPEVGGDDDVDDQPGREREEAEADQSAESAASL